jgi:beta-glucosidase
MKTNYCFSLLVLLLFAQCTGKYLQPELEAKKVQIISVGKYQFKDLNKNDQLDPYEDWRLKTDERIENLISLMTIEEKIGLMFHPSMAVPPDGVIKYDMTDEERKAELEIKGAIMRFPLATAKSFVEEKNFRCILNNGVAEPKIFAKWSNDMQEIAENSRLGIPILFSSDPRHGATLEVHITGKQYFSQWPSSEGQYGISASRDLDLAKKFGEVTAEEYRAVGLHMVLGPQIDVTTEPRWKRNTGSFSESADLTAEMLEAFMDGAQGATVNPSKILIMLKHWPGSGPHKGGKGDWLVYPGNNFNYHLIPWKAGIAKGALAVMGYYSGTYYDSLGTNFSKHLSTEVLRNQLGFKGVICTDWFAVGWKGVLHPDFQGISIKDRFEMSINAGVDQFGGDVTPEDIIELVKDERITEEQINTAARRILQWHFLLGLFEDPYVDPEAADKIVNSDKNSQSGYQAQLESIVLLTNDGTLPAGKSEKLNLYTVGIDSASACEYANIVNDPKKADLILVRTNTSERTGWADIGRENEEVNIDFPKSEWNEIKKLSASGVPVVVAFNLLTSNVVLPKDLQKVTKASLMTFDVLDKPLLDVVFGIFNPVGRLPIELPSSMDAVRKQLEDVPFDSENPMFRFGDGLSYN